VEVTLPPQTANYKFESGFHRLTRPNLIKPLGDFTTVSSRIVGVVNENVWEKLQLDAVGRSEVQRGAVVLPGLGYCAKNQCYCA